MAKTVLVTGVTSGIGYATALAFAPQGANVAISGRRADRGAEAAEVICKLGGAGWFQQADVQDAAGAKLRRWRVGAFRADRRDGCKRRDRSARERPAGEVGGRRHRSRPEREPTRHDPHRQVRHPARAATGRIDHQHLVLVGSSRRVSGLHLLGYEGRQRGVHPRLGRRAGRAGIRVNCVAPGFIVSEMSDRFIGGKGMTEYYDANIPLQRIGSADELADTILWLTSEQASYVTGQVITVDGGQSIKMSVAGF